MESTEDDEADSLVISHVETYSLALDAQNDEVDIFETEQSKSKDLRLKLQIVKMQSLFVTEILAIKSQHFYKQARHGRMRQRAYDLSL